MDVGLAKIVGVVIYLLTMILSLFWSKFTARGAIAAMVTGFVAVPLFKFGATALRGVGPSFSALSELPPAFALSAIMGVLPSIGDSAGLARLTDVAAELEEVS